MKREQTMKQRLIRSGLIMGILLGCTAQLAGQEQGGGQGQVSPVSTNAVANLDAVPPTIFVFGTNFGPSPQVFIGNDMGTLDPLVVISSTNTFIEAELVSIDPATCPLVVSSGPSTEHLSEMDVTIGAVGPEGPVGPPGTPNPNVLTEGSPTFNTAIGVDALVDNTTGKQNTALGSRALLNNTTGTANTASGEIALGANTTGNFNTASGVNALNKNTSGDNNTASGVNALFRNTTGSNNTATGRQALFNNNTGQLNTATGVNALEFNTTGNNNTANGVTALLLNTTGSSNTASGFDALNQNTIGDQNTAIGVSALRKNISGKFNTASGFQALFNNTTGKFNIALGFGAGSTATTGDNNIYIGNPGVAAESNIIRIGDNGHTNAFIAGVDVVPLSSKRFKEDIRDMGQASNHLLRLRPVTFRYRKECKTADCLEGVKSGCFDLDWVSRK